MDKCINGWTPIEEPASTTESEETTYTTIPREDVTAMMPSVITEEPYTGTPVTTPFLTTQYGRNDKWQDNKLV